MTASYLLWSFLSKTKALIKGEDPHREYHEIKSMIDRGELLDCQGNYLKSLLLHAYHNVPYYNKVFSEISLIKNGEVDLSRFDRIPILTKEIIRKHQTELISKDYTTRKWHYNSSGGSTGEPVRFIQDSLYGKWGNATNEYYYQDMLSMNRMKSKKAILWGSEGELFSGGSSLKVKTTRWLTNSLFLNSFRMTEKDMERYIQAINSYRPDLMRGYSGSLYELCRYAQRKRLSIYTPRIIVGEAETIRDEMRTEIEGIFGTKLHGLYGSREVGVVAAECRNGLMHIFIFNNHVEILDDANQPAKEGQEGKVIVTNLHNYSMPFIRYEIGDMAILGPKKCDCGCSLPTLSRVTGRMTDHFLLKDGTIIHGEYFTHLFYLKDWVKAFHVVQEDYKKIRIPVVLERAVSEPEKKDIEDKIKLVMGQDCQVIWDFVDEIPKMRSGKYLYTKSLVRR